MRWENTALNHKTQYTAHEYVQNEILFVIWRTLNYCTYYKQTDLDVSSNVNSLCVFAHRTYICAAVAAAALFSISVARAFFKYVTSLRFRWFHGKIWNIFHTKRNDIFSSHFMIWRSIPFYQTGFYFCTCRSLLELVFFLAVVLCISASRIGSVCGGLCFCVQHKSADFMRETFIQILNRTILFLEQNDTSKVNPFGVWGLLLNFYHQ